MFLSGIADEAAPEFTRQLAAHKELGWTHIEIRMIEGTNLTDISDDDFDRVVDALGEAGITVSCFAAQLANWARPISTDFDVDLEELGRAIPRMQRLGTPFIRCMSYPNSDPPLSDQEWRGQVVTRMKELASRADDGGVTLVHENCDGWGREEPATHARPTGRRRLRISQAGVRHRQSGRQATGRLEILREDA